MNNILIFEILFILIIGFLLFLFGITFGLIFIIGIVQIFLFLIFLYKRYKQSGNVTYKKAMVVGNILFGVFFVSFILVQGILINSMVKSHEAKRMDEVDVVIILGAGLRGEELSMTLEERVEKGRDFLLENKNVPVIVSGGQGEGEDIPEAEAMGRYLIGNGINESRIFYDKTSTTTFENLKNSQMILKRMNMDKAKVLIVTSDYHVYRAKILSEELDLKTELLGSQSPMFITVNYVIREYFAVVKTWVEKAL
ncbi:YdcF family protein [Rossellomorea aquimaris]|uniref:YdcF family protein n=1 Tax=Rossellomorea aquimaris TaxID=189382 RepID=UPI0009ED981F|nr:YdcF family protein [Rossellomorea aquimaris]